MKRLLLLGGLCFLLWSLQSCFSSKKMVYVNDMVVDSLYRALPAPHIEVQRGDRLNILIYAKSPELAAPFNLDLGMYSLQGKEAKNEFTPSLDRSYLVNNRGEIDFPIIGNIEVKGLSLEAVKELITQRIKDQKLIKNPVVKVDLVNFKVNVVGGVKQEGVVQVPDGRITLLEAISEAHGLSSNGDAEEVMVIREENGERKIIRHNLESKEIFDSPAYYLKQNDIVYVQPIGREMVPEEQLSLRYTSIGMSLLSLLMSVVLFLK